MRKPTLLVIDTCEAWEDTPLYDLPAGDSWYCKHCKRIHSVWRATPAEIPADLAAEALGLSGEDLQESAECLTDMESLDCADRVGEAARRVYEAEQAKARGEE